jgi:hypothetical protein
MMDFSMPISTVCADIESGWGDLLIWLPGVSNRILEGLAHQEPEVMNATSPDYLINRTLMIWTFEDVEVQIDMWNLNTNFLCGDPGRGFGVAFFNDLSGRYASHHLDAEEFDALVGGLQGAMNGSGPNYRPYRQWEEEFLDKHSGLGDVLEPGVIRPTSHDWC